MRRVLAVAAAVVAAGCGGGDDLGDLSDLHGDPPPAELVGDWQAYDTSDPLFQYYDPVTRKWSGNGMYSELHLDEKGAYEEIDILQTGAGSGCPSVLYLHFQGTIRMDGDVITFERVRGKSIGENCSGRSERTDGFQDATYAWEIQEGVLGLGAQGGTFEDKLLYDRM